MTVGVEIDRVFVVVFAAEDDFDVAVVLRAVQLDGAVLGFLLVEFGDFDRAGIGQVIRMLVQDVAVQAVGRHFVVILGEQLLYQGI